MSTALQFDLIVIGSGPGGQRAAVQAAKLGKKVLVVERNQIGGACLHTGTIPSKALREAALDSDERNALPVVLRRTLNVIQNEMDLIEDQLRGNKIEYVIGRGSFIDSHTVRVQGFQRTFEATSKVILIATGTRPRQPKEIPFDDRCIFDSDSILGLQHQPRTLAVIGAGVIGCEYASIYARMGVKVVLIDKRPELLKSMDEDIVQELLRQFQKHGIELRLGYDLLNVRGESSLTGTTRARFDLKSNQETGSPVIEREADAMLVCQGRVGNMEELGLAKLGLQADERGLIKVNDNYQTDLPHIYAVGDIIGAPQLAASSSEQGRLAALHAFKRKQAQFPSTFPYGIYTIPEISSVGRTEAELKSENTPYVVGRALYNELARGKIMLNDEGFLKLLVHAENRKLLGVHVIGAGATELVHIGQVAMAFGAKVEFFVDNVFNYPTLAEAYKVAAYNAINKIKQ